MYSAFVAWGYSRLPSSRKSSRVAGGRGREDGGHLGVVRGRESGGPDHSQMSSLKIGVETSQIVLSPGRRGRSSLVVKVSDRGWLVTSSSPVPLKNHRVGERCTLNLSRAQMSSHWCGVVVRRGGASSVVVLVT
ncbi:hypothetical protein TNCV_1789131 [Trichonephila clavipes]|nr:hypothetical protein TNCV_1789131 [Trichonephila clavipes]